MNKIIIVAVFIFWSGISFFYANSLINKNVVNNNNQFQNNTQNTNTEPTTLADELASHNTRSDCWLAIDGKIYDVTSYISSHPGGVNEIVKYCGKDGTKAFSTKDQFIPQDHSASAYAMLADFYIGDMYTVKSSAESTPESNNPDSQNNANPAPVSYTLTRALVAEHNTPSDCWVTGNNNVFDVTAYIRLHPGGERNITDYCGKDIQAAFDSQGHSANASNIFASYKIGTLGSTVSDTNINPSPPPPSQNTGEYDDDDDDEWDDD